MARFEYRVMAAPKRGVKARGVRSSEDRFANALQVMINAQAADGWEYLRTDTLPCDERKGLGGRTVVYQNMLVFRREVAGETSRDVAEQAGADAAVVDEARAGESPEGHGDKQGAGPRFKSFSREGGGDAPALGGASRSDAGDDGDADDPVDGDEAQQRA